MDYTALTKDRYQAYGFQKYWNMGYTGQNVRVGVIDLYDTSRSHGYFTSNIKKYLAPDCEVSLYQVSSQTYQGIEKQLYKCAEDGVNIISISMSGRGYSNSLHSAIKHCYNKGIIIFCSSGNTGSKYKDDYDIERFPASFPEVISVLSLDNSLLPSEFSSHGSCADITGFGQLILTEDENGIEFLKSGTSFSTPSCAFTSALEVCKYYQENGKYPTIDYMFDFIINNCVDMGKAGFGNLTGWGFFTLDLKSFEDISVRLLDYDGDGLTERVNEIKSLIENGVSYLKALEQVNYKYEIIRYETINGEEKAVYGALKSEYVVY